MFTAASFLSATSWRGGGATLLESESLLVEAAAPVTAPAAALVVFFAVSRIYSPVCSLLCLLEAP